MTSDVDLTTAEWQAALGLASHEIPRAVVLEGSWWRDRCTRQRLALLDDVRELNFPDIHVGWYRGQPIAYACVYGAARAVEPVHALGAAGTPLAIQIGSCGALQPGVSTGDILLPDPAIVGEGASQYYSDVRAAAGTKPLLDHAQASFQRQGFTVHRGPHITTSALFAQPAARVEAWRRQAYLGVDMETSAVFTVASTMGMRAASLLFVWDELLAGRTFLSGFTADEAERQQRANAALMAVALELALASPAGAAPPLARDDREERSHHGE